jgi:hypothetical protein
LRDTQQLSWTQTQQNNDGLNINEASGIGLGNNNAVSIVKNRSKVDTSATKYNSIGDNNNNNNNNNVSLSQTTQRIIVTSRNSDMKPSVGLTNCLLKKTIVITQRVPIQFTSSSKPSIITTTNCSGFDNAKKSDDAGEQTIVAEKSVFVYFAVIQQMNVSHKLHVLILRGRLVEIRKKSLYKEEVLLVIISQLWSCWS